MFWFGRYGGWPPPPRRHGGCGCGTLLMILCILAFLEMLQNLFC